MEAGLLIPDEETWNSRPILLALALANRAIAPVFYGYPPVPEHTRIESGSLNIWPAHGVGHTRLAPLYW